MVTRRGGTSDFARDDPIRDAEPTVTSEPERIVHLMALYEKMGAPLHAGMLPKPKRARRRRAPRRRAG